MRLGQNNDYWAPRVASDAILEAHVVISARRALQAVVARRDRAILAQREGGPRRGRAIAPDELRARDFGHDALEVQLGDEGSDRTLHLVHADGAWAEACQGASGRFSVTCGHP